MAGGGGGGGVERCEHVFAHAAARDVGPATEGCQKCNEDKTPVVAIRMCLTCGHVGCCDSSVGRHATKHFEETGHPVMRALPERTWRWCYVHKEYSYYDDDDGAGDP